ncbi:hypothetical protein ACFSJY_04435 [Thalassotalea euphylliae]|uniref:hypothetical protein n=1 Tax=Thalassotalea euphylliae TaxID=1655234 RepID=UPI003624CDDE
MDIKLYIDYFDEISHLDRDKQFELLEKAYRDVLASHKVPLFSIIPTMFRLMFLVSMLCASYFFFDMAIWSIVVGTLLGLLMARVAITEVKDSMLKKALKPHLELLD